MLDTQYVALMRVSLPMSPHVGAIRLEGGESMAKGTKSSGSYRSAKTGRYVTKKYAESHPNTTVKESK